MTVNAPDILYSFLGTEHPSYRGDFNARAKSDTRAFGAQVAILLKELRAAFPDRNRLRLGLMGRPGAGKSNLSRGFIRALGGWWYPWHRRCQYHGTRAGLVIHHDARGNAPPIDPEKALRAGFDVYEHATAAHSADFDLVVSLEFGAEDSHRVLTVFADDDIAATDAFAAFRESLEALEATP